jgi:hypothetical protein
MQTMVETIMNIYTFIIHIFQMMDNAKRNVDENMQVKMKVKCCPCLQWWA